MKTNMMILGLTLMLAVAVLAIMLALGVFTPSKVSATSQPTATEVPGIVTFTVGLGCGPSLATYEPDVGSSMLSDTQTMAAVDPGGGTDTLNNHRIITVTLTTVALGEEGLGTVPRHPLIKPIAGYESLLNGFTIDDRSQSVGAIASFTPAPNLAITNRLATAAPINPC